MSNNTRSVLEKSRASKISQAQREALDAGRRASVGLPSHVVRTFANRNALEWWAKMDPRERAEYLNWLFRHQDVLTTVTEDGGESWG